jgi:hypothetical protein
MKSEEKDFSWWESHSIFSFEHGKDVLITSVFNRVVLSDFSSV